MDTNDIDFDVDVDNINIDIDIDMDIDIDIVINSKNYIHGHTYIVIHSLNSEYLYLHWYSYL